MGTYCACFTYDESERDRFTLGANILNDTTTNDRQVLWCFLNTKFAQGARALRCFSSCFNILLSLARMPFALPEQRTVLCFLDLGFLQKCERHQLIRLFLTLSAVKLLPLPVCQMKEGFTVGEGCFFIVGLFYEKTSMKLAVSVTKPQRVLEPFFVTVLSNPQVCRRYADKAP
jgi:hypothetical protein